MTERENFLRAWRREGPDHIPVRVSFAGHAWRAYDPQDVDHLMTAHPALFPNYQKGSFDPAAVSYAPFRRAGVRYTDSWGCVWETNTDGMTGAVISHSLDDWSRLDSFIPPSPDEHNGWGPLDWVSLREKARQTRGDQGDPDPWKTLLRHGHTFLTLEYMRGYENLIYDMYDRRPELDRLIALVEEFNAGLVERFLRLDPEVMGFPEDLGSKNGPLISPDLFRRYIKPSYRRLMTPVRDRNILVHMHSDGHVLDLIDDLLETGVEIINLQDLVNGIDSIAIVVKGRMAIDLDVDRQMVTVNGTPQDCRDLIAEARDKLESPEGGLSFNYSLNPPRPLANAHAVFGALSDCMGN